MAGVNPALVRAYDLRGVVGRDLTEADACALGLRVAAAVRARGGQRVGIGYDGRLSSPSLAAALASGLVEGGVEAVTIGRGPTGMLYYAVHAQALDGGVMVTGSHNPADQNGFKILVGTEPVFGSALAALALNDASPINGRTQSVLPVETAYVDRLLNAATGVPAMKVVWDPGNGAAGDVLARMTAALPGEHRIINAEIDGRFPAHHPDPSVPENLRQLQDAVRTEGADLGIAFDGDGDRIGVVDADGAIVWPDQLLLLLAQAALAEHPGAPVVFDVKSSRVLADGIVAAGGRAMLSPSGYVLVRRRMLEVGAPLAGEMSGHIFYADGWYGTDDALHVAIRLLTALQGRELAAFRRALPADLRDARTAPALRRCAQGGGAGAGCDRPELRRRDGGHDRWAARHGSGWLVAAARVGDGAQADRACRSVE